MACCKYIVGAIALFCTLNGFGFSSDSKYYFDGSISRAVLENYLDRAITLAEYVTPEEYANDGAYPEKGRDTELIKHIGAKFIGRAIFRWGNEDKLLQDDFWKRSRQIIEQIHAYDDEVIFQAAIFECVSTKVSELPVPEWAFLALGLNPEPRFFNYTAMLNEKGRYIDHWAEGYSVPDITRVETQLWFTYLIGKYIDIGIEAIHWGQVELMAMNDPGKEVWRDYLCKIREFAKHRARRHYILFDAHTPHGGLIVDGKSLLDFNSFPLRVKAVKDKPLEGKLEVGHTDALYCRSKGGIAPSGWACKSMPYLVEFDNFGIRNPGEYRENDHYCWGYDEISWFYLQSKDYRKAWIKYAHDWIKRTDPNGHLQMPGSRILAIPGFSGSKCRAVAPSDQVPTGMDLEATIVEIWGKE